MITYLAVSLLPFTNIKFHNIVPKHRVSLKVVLLLIIAEDNGEFNALYRTGIAYSDSEIHHKF